MWHAQQFVLMAHATGRNDLLKKADPEELSQRFQQWFEWFRFNGLYLRASQEIWYWRVDKGDKSRQEAYIPFLFKQKLPPLNVRPEFPFSDWEGTKPASPRDYKDVE